MATVILLIAAVLWIANGIGLEWRGAPESWAVACYWMALAAGVMAAISAARAYFKELESNE